MDKDRIKDTVKQKFTEYLTEKKCRKTPERYAILDIVYSMSGYFDIDSLHESLNDHHFRVSKATLYNTMQLLLDCNLVLKHQFGSKLTYYEKAFNNDVHYHLICTQCGSIRARKDTELKSAIQNKKIKRFTPAFYSLHFFGICSQCNLIEKKKKESKTNSKKSDLKIKK